MISHWEQILDSLRGKPKEKEKNEQLTTCCFKIFLGETLTSVEFPVVSQPDGWSASEAMIPVDVELASTAA